MNNKIKPILVNLIKENLLKNIIEAKKQELEKFNYLGKTKEFLKDKNEKYEELLSNKENIFNEFSEKLEETNEEVKILKQSIEDKTKINQENCFKFVKKDDRFESIVRYLCYEATIEDTIPLIKKAYLKESLDFDDSVKEIRRLSRDLFKLKIFKEQLFSNLL